MHGMNQAEYCFSRTLGQMLVRWEGWVGGGIRRCSVTPLYFLRLLKQFRSMIYYFWVKIATVELLLNFGP